MRRRRVRSSLVPYTTLFRLPEGRRSPGRYRSICTVPGNLLAPGRYSLSLGVSTLGIQRFDPQPDLLSFEIAETGSTHARYGHAGAGVIVPVLPWNVERMPAE